MTAPKWVSIMSRLSELIHELCPDGVDHRPLGEVAGYVKDRRDSGGLDAEDFVGVDNLLPNFRGVGIPTYGPNTAKVTAFAEGDILIGNIRPYLKKIWLADRDGGCSGDVLALRIAERFLTSLDAAFLYRVLASDRFFDFNMQNARGGKMPRGDKQMILRYELPVPPLEVQQEIVRVLESFTDLEQSLVSELKLRKKQFGEYRKNAFQAVNSAEYFSLGEVSRGVFSGATPKAGDAAYYDGGEIPWLRTSEVNFGEIWDTEVKITEKALKETAVKWIPEGCLVVAISGATAGRSAINRIPTTTNQHCCCIDLDPDVIDVRYAFHWTGSNYVELKSLGRGARGDLNSRIIRDFKIPVPSLEVQKETVAKLDAFESLIQSIEQEIVLRRKQYEFYRDELLNFTPKDA